LKYYYCGWACSKAYLEIKTSHQVEPGGSVMGWSRIVKEGNLLGGEKKRAKIQGNQFVLHQETWSIGKQKPTG